MVPRSFLHPGRRIKLALTDWYALATHRGGTDQPWFSARKESLGANCGMAHSILNSDLEGQNGPRRDRWLSILVAALLVLVFAGVARVVLGGASSSLPELAAGLALLVKAFQFLRKACRSYPDYGSR
jgi:ABC-type nickel/cobalt efflux system permease component RcnA